MSVVGGQSLSSYLNHPNHSSVIDTVNDTTDLFVHFCKRALTETIGPNVSIRIWDTAILIPNLTFFLFLLYKLPRVRHKLAVTQSPVFKAFFILVYITTVFNLCRCVVSMSITASSYAGGYADKKADVNNLNESLHWFYCASSMILWLILKFFLLSAEMCVLTFGLLFGHLDSRTSIRRVLAATVLVSLVFSCAQSLLEFHFPHRHFNDGHDAQQIDLFAHGGMVFWSAASAVFVVVYVSACLLPYTRLRRRFTIPTKPTFYIYCMLLALLNGIQVTGALMIFKNYLIGMCVVDVTSYSYFALYTPLVYVMFLRVFVADPQPGALFSYAQHKDDTQSQPGEMDARSGGAGYHRAFQGLTSASTDDVDANDPMYPSSSPGLQARRAPWWGAASSSDTPFDDDAAYFYADLTSSPRAYNAVSAAFGGATLTGETPAVCTTSPFTTDARPAQDDSTEANTAMRTRFDAGTSYNPFTANVDPSAYPAPPDKQPRSDMA